tara:strand:+ start:37475 stop:37708 length:234 start_codon:yes stop_codon:yes gene_type:complete
MINGIEIVEGTHSGVGYESYKVIWEDKILKHRLLEKSATDNSKLYDVEIFGEYGEESIIFNAKNKCHAKRVYNSLTE